MPKTTPVTIKVDGLESLEQAVTQAVDAERCRLLTLVAASCACRTCKDDIAALLAGPGPSA